MTMITIPSPANASDLGPSTAAFRGSSSYSARRQLIPAIHATLITAAVTCTSISPAIDAAQDYPKIPTRSSRAVTHHPDGSIMLAIIASHTTVNELIELDPVEVPCRSRSSAGSRSPS
jgi:hypothetical protein